MRDTLKDEPYFRAYLSSETARAQRLRARLSSGEVRPDRVFPLERRLHGVEFSLFLAAYSLGEDLRVLRPRFLALLQDFPRFWTGTSSYMNLLWMMSIAVMLEVPPAQFAPLAALLDQYDRHDALLDFLAAGAQNLPAPAGLPFTCPVPYAFLGRVLEHPRQGAALLREYLTRHWYEGHRQFGLCDVHLSAEPLYTGYWSFESGALVKLLGIDGAPLRDLPYYPWDLARFSISGENC